MEQVLDQMKEPELDLHSVLGLDPKMESVWPTLWAVWIAGEGSPSLKTVIIFTLGVIVMRAAGCVINDFADRDLDGHVSRTQNRPLATGALQREC